MKPGRLAPTTPASSAAAAVVDAVLGGKPVHVDVIVPRTSVAGKMRLVRRNEALAILAEARAAFAEKKLPTDPTSLSAPGVLNEWQCEIAVRHLALAVRDPADTDKPLASLEEWRDCDDDQIAALWQRYQDLREEIDPLGNLEELTEAEFAAIAAAAKKKPPEVDLLTSFGSRKLAAYVISTAGLPAS